MTAELTYDLVYGDRSQAAAPRNRAASWSRDKGTSLASDLRDCRVSLQRGFDKLSLSGWDSISKRPFPLTLSLSKGVPAFLDTLPKERERAAAAEQYDART